MFDQKIFRGKMAEKGITKKQLANILGISRQALSRRLNNDGDFNRKEITQLREIFGKEEADSFLFANKVA